MLDMENGISARSEDDDSRLEHLKDVCKKSLYLQSSKGYRILVDF